MTRYLATELGPFGITANAIAPGGVRTALGRHISTTMREQVRDITSEVPLGRISNPEEQAAVAVFLASDDASYVTGVVVDVNGGWHMG